MAQHEEIIVWLDRRWKEAIEHHLKDETLQEHLEMCWMNCATNFQSVNMHVSAERSGRKIVWHGRKRRRHVPIPHTAL